MGPETGVVVEDTALKFEKAKAMFLAEIVNITKNSNSAQMASNWPQIGLKWKGICSTAYARDFLLTLVTFVTP